MLRHSLLITFSLLSSTSFLHAQFDPSTASDEAIKTKISKLSEKYNKEEDLTRLQAIFDKRAALIAFQKARSNPSKETIDSAMGAFEKTYNKPNLNEKKDEAITPTAPQMAITLTAPQMTLDILVGDLMVGDNKFKPEGSNNVWTYENGDAFASALKGINLRSQKIIQVNAKPVLLSDELFKSNDQKDKIFSYFQKKPELKGRFAVAYKAGDIGTPFFLVLESKPEQVNIPSTANMASKAPEPKNSNDHLIPTLVAKVSGQDPEIRDALLLTDPDFAKLSAEEKNTVWSLLK